MLRIILSYFRRRERPHHSHHFATSRPELWRRIQYLTLVDEVVAAHVVLDEDVCLLGVLAGVHRNVLTINEGNVIAGGTLWY